MRRMIIGSTLLLAVLLPAMGAMAQDEPKEKIARVSFTQGDTTYQRGDDEDWTGIGANTPLMTGDSLYAADDGRLELDLGHGNVARLDTATALDIVNLTSEMTQLGLSQGYVNLRVRDVPLNHTVEVDSPLAAATLWEPGLYRVDVDRDTVRFAVVTGSLSVVLDGEQLDVQPGELLELQGGKEQSYSYSNLPQASAFDRWSEERDTRRQKSVSSRYVHNDVEGYDDLDDHGSWRQDATYGNVWYPSRVSQSWAPYQTGNWVWQDPYGWTWVSYEPWGWAPYHYGRWVNVGNSWGWVPPPPVGYAAPPAVMSIRPVYSPALVAFVGGSNWSVGVSIGGGGGCMGWVPLAPADPYYYPWQRPVHVTNVVYKNVYINNSVTVINYNNFGRGVVTPIHVGPDVIRRAPIMGGAVIGIAPNRASLHAYPGVKVAPRAIPSRAIRERDFVVRSVPPPKPVPFNKKVTEIQKTGKPYAKPIHMDDSVGKPFNPGMKLPQGVKAKSAFLPENAGPNQPKLKAKAGQQARPPKPIEKDITRPKDRPPQIGGPGGQPQPEKPIKQKDKGQPGIGGPGTVQPKPEKPWKNKDKGQPGIGGPGGEQPKPEKPWKNKDKAQPGIGGPGGEQPKPEKPWKNKDKAQPGIGGPGGEQPKPEKPWKNKDKAQPGIGGPGGEQPKPEKPWKNKDKAQPGIGLPGGEQPKPEKPVKNKDKGQPGIGGPGGEQPKPEKPKKQKEFQPPDQPKPEKPKKQKEFQPPDQPSYGNPEKPKKQKEFQPPDQPSYGNPEKPKKQKEFQPPDQPSYGNPEKPKKQKEFQPQPGPGGQDKPDKPQGGQMKSKQAQPQPQPQPNQEQKKKKKDKEKAG